MRVLRAYIHVLEDTMIDDTTIRAERPQEPANKNVDKSKEQTEASPSDKSSDRLIDRTRQHPIAIGFSLSLIVIGLVAGTIWYLNARHYESTHRAHRHLESSLYDTLIRVQEYLKTQSATGNTSGSSVAMIGQILHRQAVLLAHIDVFVTLAMLAGLMIPLALSLRTVKRKGPAPAH